MRQPVLEIDRADGEQVDRRIAPAVEGIPDDLDGLGDRIGDIVDLLARLTG